MGQRLGQHFLKNKHLLRRIAAALEPAPGDTVIEIGAGHGELTRELLAINSQLLEKEGSHANSEMRVITIEKDHGLATSLKGGFKNSVEIVEDDALKILPALIQGHNLKAKSYKLAGNIPYYLTGRLLRVVSELEPKPTCAVFTVQREVAERLCAHPIETNPTHKRCPMCGMNLLAAAVQVWATPEIVGYVPRKEFSPAPKVDSAIVRLKAKNYEQRVVENYYRLIKILFQQPRKTVLNNLRRKGEDAAALAEKLRTLGVDPGWRPQNLSVETILQLSEVMDYNGKDAQRP